MQYTVHQFDCNEKSTGTKELELFQHLVSKEKLHQILRSLRKKKIDVTKHIIPGLFSDKVTSNIDNVIFQL